MTITEPPAPAALFKTTIVIWSPYRGDAVELSRLAEEAESGDAYCSALVPDPCLDEDWDGTEFFGDAADGTLLLCDGCFACGTCLLAECADGCAEPLDHDGKCLHEGPPECQWRALPGRLRAVSRADVDGLLPWPGQDGDGLWFLHWDDRYKGPFPSSDAALQDRHAARAQPTGEDSPLADLTRQRDRDGDGS